MMTVVESDVSCAIGTRIEASKRYPMRRNEVVAAFGTMLVIAGVIAAVAPISSAENKESVLHTFTYHADGGFPFAGLTFDAKGNLYGVSYLAGDGNEGVCCGVVFQLTPNKTGWKFKVIYTFTGGVTDGEAPSGSVVFDSSGNLYVAGRLSIQIYGYSPATGVNPPSPFAPFSNNPIFSKLPDQPEFLLWVADQS